MYKVDFVDVGRNKKSFSKEMKDIDYDNFYEVVKPHLLSSFSIDFVLSDEDGTGMVLAGFCIVGRFRINKLEGNEDEL